MGFWAKLFDLFKRERKSKCTTQTFKRIEGPLYKSKPATASMEVMSQGDLDEAVQEEKDVVHVDFNKVRKITRRFERGKLERKTNFYDDSGKLMTD